MIDCVLSRPRASHVHEGVRRDVFALCQSFPLYDAATV